MARVTTRQMARLPGRRGGTPPPGAVPLLPMLAALLLLMAAVQVVSWWLEVPKTSQTNDLPATVQLDLVDNPIVAWQQWWRDLTLFDAPSSLPAARRNGVMARLEMPVQPHNIVLGDPLARVTVTVLNDPSCAACKTLLTRWLGQLPQTPGVRLVYKFWPAKPGQLTAGMALEMARDHGVLGAFWPRLQAAETDLSDVEILQLLEASGMPLAAQRQALSTQADRLIGQLSPDIALAQQAQLPPPPVVLVDDAVLVPPLDPLRAVDYVQLRLQGKSLGQDFFWMVQPR